MNVLSGPVAETAKNFIPGGELVYSQHPAKTKLWKEPPNRGIDGEILLVNTDKTVLPDMIVLEEEVFAEDQQVETTQPYTERRTANMIGSGRLPPIDSRLKGDEVLPTPGSVLLINESVLRGMASSAFYVGDFFGASRYLHELSERGAGKVDSHLLELETFAYLGKSPTEIISRLARFDLTLGHLVKKLSRGRYRYQSRSIKNMTLYHLLRWALELRHNKRLYGAIFVCRSISMLPNLHRSRLHQFDLAYALFVEIALRILNIFTPEGIPLQQVLVECLDSTFKQLLGRIHCIPGLAKAIEWKRIVGCCNAVAFLCNMTGDFDRARRRINLGLDIIARELHHKTMTYPDLKVNQALMHLKSRQFIDAVKCYEEAARAYRTCDSLDSHRMEMIERADRMLIQAKKLRDVKNDEEE